MSAEQIKVYLPKLDTCGKRLIKIKLDLNNDFAPVEEQSWNRLSIGNVTVKSYSMEMNTFKKELKELISQTESFISSTESKFESADKNSEMIIDKATT